MPDSDRSLLARWLRAIPQSRYEPRPLQDLPGGEVFGRGLAALLATWGAVDLSAQGVRAASQPAYYFLHSLAAWAESGEAIVGDWSEVEGVRPDAGVQHGSSLVFLMEQERLRRQPDAPAIRRTEVAEALVVRPGHPPQFLVQWDARAGQYQVLGGRRKDDRDWQEPIEQTAIRELEEELHEQVSYAAGDFTLSFLASFEGNKRVSPSFGALTAYHFTFYQALNLPPIELGADDRWVTRDEMLAGRTADGRPLRANHIPPLEAAMGKRIDQLPSSFQE